MHSEEQWKSSSYSASLVAIGFVSIFYISLSKTVYLIMISIRIFLMANVVENLFMCLFSPIDSLCWCDCSSLLAILKWNSYFLTVELWEFFIYAGYKSFVICGNRKFFLSVCSSSYYSLTSVFHRTKCFDFDEVLFIIYFYESWKILFNSKLFLLCFLFKVSSFMSYI